MERTCYGDAVLAASRRAEACRRRLEQLRSGGGYSPESVTQAQARLDEARRRTELAYHRVAVLTANRSGGQVWQRPPTAPRPVDPRDFPARLGRLEVGAMDVWITYVALCGRCSALEVDAALHGALLLPDLDNQRLGQALWEHENGW